MHQYAAYGGIDMDVIYIDYEKMKSNPIKEEVKPVPEEPKTEEPVQKEEIKEPVQEQTPIEETKTESVGILELIRDLFYNLLKLIFGNK